MPTYTFKPSADYSDDGWSVQGSQGTLNATWSSSSDSNYTESPPTKGLGVVAMPQNLSALPSGAVINSVSVVVRAATGSGSIPAGQVASLTCAVQCADDTTAYVQRTIYPTSSPATYTVATYTIDPLGNAWDIYRLNQVLLNCYAQVSVTDAVRVYEFYLVLNYSASPVVSLNQPSGTVNTASPTIAWTYTEETAGDPQSSVEYRIFTAAQVAATGFSPATSAPIYDNAITAAGNIASFVLPTALPSNTYTVYVQATSYKGAVSAWSSKQFTVNAPTPGVPGVEDPSGKAPVGQGIVSVVADNYNGCSILTLRDTSNLYGVHMADVNVDDSGESWTLTNCTMVESTSAAFPGEATSWAMTAIANGTMSALTGFVSISSASALTASLQDFAGTTTRTVQLDIKYFDDQYNTVSTHSGSAISDSTTTWLENQNVDTAPPATATKAQLNITVAGAVASEVHHFTHVGLMPGTQSPWSSGGQTSSNILSSWYSNSQGTAPSGQAWIPGPGTSVGTSGPVGTQGFDGTTCNTMTCTTGSSPVGLRAAGTVFTATTSGNVYTLNKPAGTLQGDLMMAFVNTTENTTYVPGVVPTAIVTPPTGWQLVDSSYGNSAGHQANLFILARTAGASEPSTWSGMLTNNVSELSAVVVGYSGAAPLTSQFIAEAQSATFSPNAFGSSYTQWTTPTVTNTDPNAWRISAFAIESGSATGSFSANIQPPTQAIEFVSSAWTWHSLDSTDNYYINCPTGVVSGDLMIATVLVDPAGAGGINVPSGWTLVDETAGALGNPGIGGMYILKRTAGSSEPAGWAGTFPAASRPYAFPKQTTAAAYRNCAAASSQFVAEGMTEATNASQVYTNASTSNTNANAWRVVAFGANSGSQTPDYGQAIYSTTPAGRSYSSYTPSYQQSGPGTGGLSIFMGDSNGPVGVGVTQDRGWMQQSTYAISSWVGYLVPATGSPTPPANETNRVAQTISGSSQFGALEVYDSNGAAATNAQSVTLTGGTAFGAACGWIGVIVPSAPGVVGLVSATLESAVDISQVNPGVVTQAGSQVTVGASFIGSTAGTALITAMFYRANVLLNSTTLQAGAFSSTSGGMLDCSANFSIPDGTTAIRMTVASPGRNASDVVYWDRSHITLGADSSYRTGTAAPAHPVWSYPQLQYAENTGDGNGFGDWADVPGTNTNVPSFGDDQMLVFEDHSIIPLVMRKYRARTVSYGLNGDQFASAWGADSLAASFQATNWWLKDILDPANNFLVKVKYDVMQFDMQNTAVQFQALGEDAPVVITEGFKTDTFTVKMIPVDQDEFAELVDILKSGKTLYLQSDIDKAWWVLPLGDVQTTVLATNQRQINPLREVDVTFLEVGAVL